MFQDNFFRELVVDNFAGGGGASTGMELALGAPVDIAVNHNADAIAMHKVNHPYTRHYQEDVWKVDPLEVTQGRSVGLLWGSPDCTHFSKAKGGTPVEKKIRGLAWVLLKWAGKVRPRVIMMENVEEFTTWGPIIPMRVNGRCVKEIVKTKHGNRYITAEKGEVLPVEKQHFVPDKKRAGQTFKRFIEQLRALGYEVEWRILKACDYGAPTIRKRFYLVARCDGKPIVWPKPTHGKGEGLLPYKTAADCIEMSLPCPSIFGRKKALAVNTLRRIARGMDKFVIKNPNPFLMQMNFDNPPLDINRPLTTETSANHHYFLNPALVPIGYGERKGQLPRVNDIQEPLSTVVSSCKQNVATPFLTQYHSEQSKGEVRGQRMNDPLMTVDGANRYGLTSGYLTKYFSGEKQKGADLQKPCPTVTGIDHNAFVAVNLSSRYGNGKDGRGAKVDEPAPTVTGTNHSNLLAANVVHYYGGADHASDMNNPLPTVTALPRHYLTEAHMCVLRNNMDCRRMDEPFPTVTAKEHEAVICTYLQKIDSDQDLGNWPKVRELLNEYAGYHIADDEILILEIDGVQYFISDIGMRMLKARELMLAQGFPEDYCIDIESRIGKKYSEAKQIERLGNAVCPPVAEALVRANCADIAARNKIRTMAELERTMSESCRRTIRRKAS